MKDKTVKWLGDIKASAETILAATRDKDFGAYKSDAILRAAVERHFEIIGESVNRIARHDPDSAEKISAYSQIIAFRNTLIHGYDLIDDEEVWRVVRNDLPALYHQVEALLANQ